MIANELFARFKAAIPTQDEMVRQSVLAARLVSRETIRALDRAGPHMVRETDFVVAGAQGPLAARVFWPETAVADGHVETGGLVFFHGGGFVVDGIETHAGLCRHLADAAGCAVMSVEYRLAPEHPFPAAYDDAIAAWADIVARAGEFGFDPSRLAIGGDSAGGNLAVGVALRALEGDVPAPIFQLLLYPWMQLGDTGRSRMVLKEGFFASEAVMNFCREAYLGKGNEALAHDPRVSPLYAINIKGLSPCHIVTVGWDPLQHDGDTWANRLTSSNVAVSKAHYPGLTHGALSVPGLISDARNAILQSGQKLGSLLYSTCR